MVSVVKEPRANISRLSATLAQSLFSKGPRDWHPLGQFTDLRVVCPGLDRTGQICWCWFHCLTKDKSRLSPGRYFFVLGDSSISLTLVQACSTLSREGVRWISWCSLTVCLVTLTLVNLLRTWVQEFQRLPAAFSPWRTVPVSVWLLWVWINTHSGTCKYCLGNEDWQDTLLGWY